MNVNDIRWSSGGGDLRMTGKVMCVDGGLLHKTRVSLREYCRKVLNEHISVSLEQWYAEPHWSDLVSPMYQVDLTTCPYAVVVNLSADDIRVYKARHACEPAQMVHR